MLTHRERGRLGSKKLWSKYKTDPIFRERIRKLQKERAKKRYLNRIKFISHLNKHELEVSKARLCGFLAADGCVLVMKSGHHDIRFFPDHIELANLFKETFKNVYGKDLPIKNYGTYFDLRLCNKDIVLDLMSIAKYDSMNWTLPNILNSKESKMEWLRAYFDADGYVCKNYVQVQGVNRKGLEQIQALLKEFNIESRLYSYKRKQENWNINYLLNIPKRDMRKFLTNIGFNHPIKMEKLQRFVAEVA